MSKRLPLVLAVILAASTLQSQSFSDVFNTGALPPRWVVDSSPAPGSIQNVNQGSFIPFNVNLQQGVIDLLVTQSGSNPVVSEGAEVRTAATYGYGAMTCWMRASSTSFTPNGSGMVTSGQISSCFFYVSNSTTEIDAPEIQGQDPHVLWYTSWTNGTRDDAIGIQAPAPPESSFHPYRVLWQPGKITYFFDGNLVATQVINVPTVPAYLILNHWGTNSTGWGGLATVGIDRHMYISRVAYTALADLPKPPGNLTVRMQ